MQHQEALIEQDQPRAQACYAAFHTLLKSHIALEDSTLAPLHQQLPQPQWRTLVYTAEHEKILQIAQLMAERIAAPSAPTGKDLLIAVVGNVWPPGAIRFDCADSIPAFADIKLDGDCSAIAKTPPQMAFLGDSHIAHYRSAALLHFQALAPIVVSQTECLPFSTDSAWGKQVMGQSCRSKQEAVLRYLQQTPSIKTVVLSARWSLLMTGKQWEREGEKWRTLSSLNAENRQSFIKNGQAFIGVLTKAGKQVVLMRDIPDLDFDPATCYNIRPVRLGKAEIRQNCSMGQEPFEPRRQLQNAVLDEVIKPFSAVKVYDPVPVFCQKGVCKASDGTLPYYRNSDHVNNYGAELVFKDFVPKVFPELKP